MGKALKSHFLPFQKQAQNDKDTDNVKSVTEFGGTEGVEEMGWL